MVLLHIIVRNVSLSLTDCTDSSQTDKYRQKGAKGYFTEKELKE